jgi:hypothetical protein
MKRRIVNNLNLHHLKFCNHMRKRIVKHLLERVRDKGFQNPLVMISLYTSWMIHPNPFQRHLHLLMQMIGRKPFVARWIPS